MNRIFRTNWNGSLTTERFTTRTKALDDRLAAAKRRTNVRLTGRP